MTRYGVVRIKHGHPQPLSMLLVLILLMKSLPRRLSVLDGDIVRGCSPHCQWWCYTPRLSVGDLPPMLNRDSWRVDGVAESRHNDDEDWALSVRGVHEESWSTCRPCLLQYEYDRHGELATYVVFADNRYRAFLPDKK